MYKPQVSGLDIRSPEPFLGAPHLPPSIRCARLAESRLRIPLRGGRP
jgi:hypothetical protein